MIWFLSFLCVFHSCIIGHMASQSHHDIKSNAALAIESATSHQQHQDDMTEISSELHRSLRFDPPKLDFGVWPIGTARSHTVTLVNKNANRSVYLSSVSGKTPAFYSSFFENKVVPPQGNTTFNVVFLPRIYGTVTTSLMIHTSFGQAKLFVKGEGTECPYRLKPIVGIRAPFNSTLTPEIHMYNPHDKTLQILEVYSSGGQFQLELPSGGQEGNRKIWEIPPHSTKPIIRIRFHGLSTGNHTAYIRIKISEMSEENEANENILVIPVEFEILSKHGIYVENPIIDFGRLTTFDKAKSVKIELKNSGKKPIQVIDYSLSNCKTSGVIFNTKDSTIVINPEQIENDSFINGQLIIRSMTQHNTSEIFEFIMFIRAEIFKGTLTFEKNITTFVTKSKEYSNIVSRNFYVRNDFAFPIAIKNVTLDNMIITSKNIHIFNLKLGVLQPGEQISLFDVQVIDNNNSNANVQSYFTILTNITSYQVPVIVCTGLLNWQTMDSEDSVPLSQNTILDLGTIPFGELSHSGYIILQNNNPITVELSSWDFTSPEGVYFHSTFLGCLKAEKQQQQQQKTHKTESFTNAKFELCFNLRENDLAIYKIAIQSFMAKSLTGAFKIWTNHEQITTAVKFTTIMGKLEVHQNMIYFKNCFPGKLCSSDLSIRSTFPKPMRINTINFTDPGLHFIDVAEQGTWINPNTVTKVGQILFEPSKLCQNKCYVTTKEDGNNITTLQQQPFTSGSNGFNFDETELRRRTELFRHLKWYLEAMSFTLNSSEIRQFKLNVTIDIEWPKLVNGRQAFSAVEVGHTHNAEILINNPTDSPLLVELFLSDPKLSKNTRLSLPLEVVDICAHCYLTDKDVFFMPDRYQHLVIAPMSNSSVPIEFTSNDIGVFSTILHIRNNLTLYEAVWLTAKTVQSQFKFGNRKPGSTTPLLFEVGEKHLMSCLNMKVGGVGGGNENIQVTTKRSFTARNTGEIPILVESFLIGGKPCEGYGFKVLDCNRFELKANGSKKIDIAFSPDFTLARISRPLTLKTNLSYYVNYNLLATMPPSSLDQCFELLPRPSWEERIKSIALILLFVIVIFVLITAHLDAEKILADHLRYMSRDKGPVQPALNLRNIAIKSSTGGNCDSNSFTLNTTPPNNGRSGRTSNKNCTISNIRKRTTTTKKSTSNTSAICSDLSWARELTKNCSISKEPITTTNTTPNSKISAIAGCGEKIQRANKDEHKSYNTIQAQKTSIDSEKCNGSSSSPSSESCDREKQINIDQKTTFEAHKTDGGIQSSIINYSNNNQMENNKKQKNPIRKTKGSLNQNDKIVRELSGDSLKERSNEEEQRQQKLPTVSSSSSSSSSRSPKQIVKTPEPKKTIEVATKSIDSLVSSNFESPSSPNMNKQHQQLNSNSSISSSSSSSKKYGKTPGRERKKENSSTNLKRYERKQKTKVNCLNFSSPLANANSNNNNNNNGNNSVLPSAPWDTNQISFSNVVAQKCPTNSADEVTNDCYNNYHPSGFEVHDWKDAEINSGGNCSNNSIFDGKVQNHPYPNQNTNENFNLVELGPIGSKKSPSSTPIWEPLPMANIQLAKPSLCNNSSFFSNILPSYVYNESNQTISGIPTDLYDLKNAEEQLQRQWEASEYLFSLRQQQNQNHQKISENGAYQKETNWPMGTQTWTPMGYGQPSPTTSSGSMNPWIRPNIRPPPGLEFNKRDDATKSTSSQIFTTTNLAIAAAATNSTVPIAPDHSSDVTQQQNGQLMMPDALNNIEIDPIQPFDPFSSLSSIWSDNWNKNKNSI